MHGRSKRRGDEPRSWSRNATYCGVGPPPSSNPRGEVEALTADADRDGTFKGGLRGRRRGQVPLLCEARVPVQNARPRYLRLGIVLNTTRAAVRHHRRPNDQPVTIPPADPVVHAPVSQRAQKQPTTSGDGQPSANTGVVTPPRPAPSCFTMPRGQTRAARSSSACTGHSGCGPGGGGSRRGGRRRVGLRREQTQFPRVSLPWSGVSSSAIATGHYYPWHDAPAICSASRMPYGASHIPMRTFPGPPVRTFRRVGHPLRSSKREGLTTPGRRPQPLLPLGTTEPAQPVVRNRVGMDSPTSMQLRATPSTNSGSGGRHPRARVARVTSTPDRGRRGCRMCRVATPTPGSVQDSSAERYFKPARSLGPHRHVLGRRSPHAHLAIRYGQRAVATPLDSLIDTWPYFGLHLRTNWLMTSAHLFLLQPPSAAHRCRPHRCPQ